MKSSFKKNITPSKYTITIINPIVIWFFLVFFFKSKLLPATKCQPTAASRDVRWPAARPRMAPKIRGSRPKTWSRRRLPSPAAWWAWLWLWLVMISMDVLWITVGDPKWLIGNPLYDWCLFIYLSWTSGGKFWVFFCSLSWDLMIHSLGVIWVIHQQWRRLASPNPLDFTTST